MLVTLCYYFDDLDMSFVTLCIPSALDTETICERKLPLPFFDHVTRLNYPTLHRFFLLPSVDGGRFVWHFRGHGAEASAQCEENIEAVGGGSADHIH